MLLSVDLNHAIRLELGIVATWSFNVNTLGAISPKEDLRHHGERVLPLTKEAASPINASRELTFTLLHASAIQSRSNQR